ncbi:MAG TPA: sigma-70 family RNA polymerase sigma factor [Solirubrobacterales bacterium]|nr:sigma-70 family RNA polymerase sigma factor [Solirubrobacterales bacterium]
MPPPAEGFAARFVIGPALRTQPDRRLVTLVREGYENAFEEIVRRYGKPLTRYASAIVGSRAEDVTQDSFSKALLALRRDRAEIELRPWLFRIVRNTALNDLRDSPPSAEALAEVIASGAGPAEELERREELADLMRRLQSLPEAQRAAIVMRELEGLSHEEIANALGLSDGGARQAIYRARRSLRDGAGMLLPLPLLKALLAGAAGSPAVEAAAGTAGVGGVAGAGVALKAAAATVLVAGAVGAGVAVDHSRQPQRAAQPTAAEIVADDSAQTTRATPTRSEGPSGIGSPSGSGRHGEREPGDDHGGHGSNQGSGKPGDGRGGPRSGSSDNGTSDDENRGSGGGGSRHEGPGDDHGGGPGPSGHGGSDDGGGSHQSGRSSGGSSGPGGGGSSGPGGSSEGSGSFDGSGKSGSSSSSGSGSSGDSSGSTSGSGSGSGSSESGSSGGSGSGGGGSSSGEEGGGSEPDFESSGDSHGGSGFSMQMKPQTQEES